MNSAKLILVLLLSFFIASSQVSIFYPSIDGKDLFIDGDYLYFVDNNEIRKADISNPLFSAPPSVLIYDQPSSDVIYSIEKKDDELYFSSINSILGVANSTLYKIDLLDLVSPAEEVVLSMYDTYLSDICVSEGWLYGIFKDSYWTYRSLDRINTSSMLPTTFTEYIDGEVSAVEIIGGSMYFAESIHTESGAYLNGEIFFKNLFLDSIPEMKFTGDGKIEDLMIYDGMLYFTDEEGLKRIDPLELLPTSELLISNAEYGTLGNIVAKSYMTGEEYIFVLSTSTNRLLRLDLNDATLDVNKPMSNENIIFPNPTSDLIYLKSKFAIEELILYDFSGKKVFETIFSNTPLEYQINFSNLKSGIYILHIKNIQNSERMKIIKN